MDESSHLKIAFGISALFIAAVAAFLFFQKKTVVPEPQKTETVSTEAWSNQLKAVVSIGLCAQPSYYDDCFSYPTSCSEETQALAMKCYDEEKVEMPKVLRLPKDGVYWGRTLSACAVKKAAVEFTKYRKKDRRDCVNEKSWNDKNPAPTMTKARFLFSAEIDMPVRFCDEKSPVRACFDVTAEECGKQITEFISECEIELDSEIPGDLKIPQETIFWGTRLGRCAGEKIEKSWKTKKRKDCAVTGSH